MKLQSIAAAFVIYPAILAVSQAAWAQHAPTAGEQLLQIPSSPVAPAARPAMQLEVIPPKRPPTAIADADSVMVKRLRIGGAKAIDADELVRVSGFVAGTNYSLDQLRALAASITAHYHRQGFFLAQTYLPTQDITDGTVSLEVLEGQYGQVNLRNRSALADRVAHGVLKGLHSAAPVNSASLEHRLLVLSDLPGINVKSTLTPGATTGTTDLSVDVTPGPRIAGSLEADNHGNTHTGSNRLGASVSINEPFGIGDAASARVLTSGEGMAYGRVSYQAQVGLASMGLAYTNLKYELGGAFASTQSRGTARIGSVFAHYPLMRSRSRNLNLQWSFDSKALSDRVGVGDLDSAVDKDALVSTASLKGDLRDLFGSGQSNFLVSWSRGDIRLQSPDAVQADSASAQSAGGFDKLTYLLGHQQAMGADSVFYVGLNGQWASKNLDASEKFSLGGVAGVRAYPSGEATGDEGTLISLEARVGLPSLAQALSGQVQLIAFVDAGTVTLNKSPWDNLAQSNTRTLRGAGLGVHYQSTSNWILKVYYAFKLGDESATSSTDSSGRFWLHAAKSL